MHTAAFPIQIVYQKLHSSKSLEDYIRCQAQKLAQYFHHILNCRVLVEIVNQQASQGKLFHVCVDLKLPHRELVVNRCPLKNHAHENAFVTIRDAFIALTKKLQHHAQKLKGKIKRHDVSSHSRVVDILPEAEHGVMPSFDGGNMDFAKNSSVDDNFEKLDLGSKAHFAKGRQPEQQVLSKQRKAC